MTMPLYEARSRAPRGLLMQFGVCGPGRCGWRVVGAEPWRIRIVRVKAGEAATAVPVCGLLLRLAPIKDGRLCGGRCGDEATVLGQEESVV